MKNKPLVITAVVAIIVIVAAVVVWPMVASRPRNQRKPGSLMGEWTDNTSTGTSIYKYGRLNRATVLGFGPNGREVVDAFVAVPHHPRPLPITSIGIYAIHGATLVQTLPSRSDAFASLGLHTTQTSTQTTLTSLFTVRGNQLTLSQPAGKSASFTLTAAAIPPTSPPGGGPGQHH